MNNSNNNNNNNIIGHLIFLHGSGDRGDNLKEYLNSSYIYNGNFINELFELGILCHFPNSPLKSYSLINGQKSYIWFDRNTLSIDGEEDTEGINNSIELIDNLIEDIINKYHNNNNNNNLPLFFIGGFSMGGSLALNIIPRLNHRNIIGIFAFGSFLYRNSFTYQLLLNEKNIINDKIPLLIGYGNNDELIHESWVMETLATLNHFDIPITFYNFNNCGHEINTEIIEKLISWLTPIILTNISNNKLNINNNNNNEDEENKKEEQNNQTIQLENILNNINYNIINHNNNYYQIEYNNIPDLAIPMICSRPILTRGSEFKLEKSNSQSNTIICNIYSSTPNDVANILLIRIKNRLMDPQGINIATGSCIIS